MTMQGSDTANTHQPTGGPPPYSLQTTQASSDGTSTSTAVKSALLPNVPASNYQFIRQVSASITGTFVIDPSLEVPDDLILGAVPPDDNSENHFNKDKNLSLEAKDASITADIWLVNEGDTTEEDHKGPRRAVIEVKTHGLLSFIWVKLHSSTPHPYTVLIYGKSLVRLALPSDFVGPLTLDIGDTISFSESVKSRLATFSAVNGKRNCFIGNFRNANYKGKNDWTGSTVDVKTEGILHISFAEEERNAGGCTIM